MHLLCRCLPRQAKIYLRAAHTARHTKYETWQHIFYSFRYKYKDHSGKPCEGWESFKTKKEA